MHCDGREARESVREYHLNNDRLERHRPPARGADGDAARGSGTSGAAGSRETGETGPGVSGLTLGSRARGPGDAEREENTSIIP